MNVELMLAVDRQGGIGKDGRLPWPNCKEDMQRFMKLSKDTVCVMGRMTYHDIAAAAKERGKTDEEIAEHGILKGRESVVLSSTQTDFPGAVGMMALRNVFNKYVETDKRIVVIGGEKLFIQALTWANTIHVTVFDQQYACDRYFPVNVLQSGAFRMEAEKITLSELEHEAYFATYHRINPVAITL